MKYRVGPDGLADDMFNKMKAVGLALVHVHAPYFPDGFEGAIGVDRAFNHELPTHTDVLPIILVADVIIHVEGKRYRSYTNGYYWTSALLLPAGSKAPNGYRPMTKGEGICALAQYPTIRGLQFEHQMFFVDEVYLDASGKLIMNSTVDSWAQYSGFIPLETRGSTRGIEEYR